LPGNSGAYSGAGPGYNRDFSFETELILSIPLANATYSSMDGGFMQDVSSVAENGDEQDTMSQG